MNKAIVVPFLNGGGELGELIRNKDWGTTALGSPETWPSSLQVTLGMLLHARFPMFLFWGSELTCFYNDAYRKFFGDSGKHPQILGMNGEEAFTESWDIISPMLEEVQRTGEGLFLEDLLAPVQRNNQLEEGFWTFGYSPVFDPYGKVCGILVNCLETTERIKNRKILAESERRFRLSLQKAPVSIIIVRSDDFTIEMVNEAFLEMSKKREEGVIAKKLFEVFPDSKETILPFLERVIETKQMVEGNDIEVIINRTGKRETGYFNFLCQIHRGERETDENIIVVISEVTEKVKVKEAIKAAENRLRLATEATNLATYELNLRDRSLIASPIINDIFGHSRDTKMVHQNLRDQLHPEDRPSIDTYFKEAMKTGKYQYESRIIKPNGDIAWIKTFGDVVFDTDGEPERLIGTIRDITPEKEQQQIIIENERKFRFLADSMPHLIWTAEPDGTMNYCNRTLKCYGGLDPKLDVRQLAGEFFNMIHPEDHLRLEQQRTFALRTGTEFLMEHRIREHTGKYRWFLSKVHPQKNPDGTIVQWVGSSTDIQEHKDFMEELERKVAERTQELSEANERLEYSVSELKKLNDELESFAYVSSHDLQEPLRKIQMFSSRILGKEQDNLSEQGRYYFKRMQLAANRMQNLIQDLLTYSRTNDKLYQFESVSLHQLLEDACTELSELFLENKVEIQEGAMVTASVIPFQFVQLFKNLLTNAIKFSKPGIAPLIRIHCETIQGDQLFGPVANSNTTYCKLLFSDNGIGFKPEHKDQIFEVFRRLHDRSAYEGTGIGLAIVKKIVDNHSGFIEVDSTPEVGTEFTIYFPANP
ncbi:PAS domain S-box protein [Robertkochia solimangrovi]|uniref:PAS domain S-box protein n=1 Tax=Robertkochia solimangrovi TaxID=2213046 RepID=UPI00117BF354|nr:PAS domain S-box protein [Robertkochia solimangrovi]TRZ42925.1 hypothetical protein DMZ48_12735 [Robertkochia solimangrovi]